MARVPTKARSPRALDKARLEELQCFGILDTPPEPVFDDLARLAARIFGASMATIGFTDSVRHWFKAAVGVKVQQIPREGSLCDYTLVGKGVFEVRDASVDRRFAKSSVVVGPPYIRFYAGAPLLLPNGHALGTICVFDPVPTESRLDRGQRESLMALARQIVAQLELKRTVADLRRMAAERHHTETALRQSEERFQHFMNGGPTACYIKDAAGRFVYVNEPCATRFQKRVEEWIGRTDAELFGEEHASQVVEHDLTVLNQERTVVAEESVPMPDGQTKCWLSYKFLLHDDQGRKQLGGISFDITERKATERERERLVNDLREALAEVKALSGLLPICSWCKKVRDDAGYWQQIESYLSARSEVEFTHGICPDCVGKLYPGLGNRLPGSGHSGR